MSDPAFTIVDSLQDFYGRDSLVTLRVFEPYSTSLSMQAYADTIAEHGWRGRFVVDSMTRVLDNYMPLTGAGGVPTELVIDRNSHVAAYRVGSVPMSVYRQMIDGVK